jgi:hypothetical protein
MKNIFFILLFVLTTFEALSCETSIPVSYVPTFLAPPVVGAYQKCDARPEEQCLCIDNVSPYYAELADNVVLDYVAKLQVQSCTKGVMPEPPVEGFNEYQDCDDRFYALVCEEGTPINNYDSLEVYCAKDVMKVDGKKFIVNETKRIAYDQKQVADAQYAVAEAAAIKAMDCGKSVQRMMLIRNASKELTTTQVKEIVATYASIKALLDTGSLVSAREEIMAVTVNEPLVTQADKDALIAKLDSCK